MPEFYFERVYTECFKHLAYGNKCSICAKIICWIFGHTHWYTDILYDDIPVLSNPHGYRHEKTGYKSDKIININI